MSWAQPEKHNCRKPGENYHIHGQRKIICYSDLEGTLAKIKESKTIILQQ